MIRPEDDTRKFEDLEDLVWSPDHSLSDKVIDQFLVIARSVGTFARAVDEASTLKQPSLHMSAAAASRDITLFHAMELLHNCKYDFSRARSVADCSTTDLINFTVIRFLHVRSINFLYLRLLSLLV